MAKLEEDEAERLRRESLPKPKPDPNIAAFGDIDLMGLSEEELDA